MHKENPIAVQKDVRYSWVALTAVFFLGTLVSGHNSNFGILLPEYVEEFQVAKAQIAVIQSLFNAAMAGFGIVAGTLTKMYGLRTVAMLSSVIGSSGYLISGFLSSLPALYVTHGLMQGCSIIMMLNVAEVAVATYFDKKKAFAFSLKTAGYSVGYIVYAPFMKWAVNEYGRKGSQILYAGICLNGLVAGYLLRPVTLQLKNKEKYQIHTELQEHDEPEISFLHVDQEVITLQTLNEKQGISDDEIGQDFKKKRTCARSKRHFLLSIKSIFNHLSFMKRPELIFYMLSFMTIISGHSIPYYYLVAKIKSLNIASERGAILVSVIGLSGLITRPVFGIVADKLERRRALLYGICGIIVGLMTSLSYFLTNFIPLLCYCILFGIVTAGYIGIHAAILSDLLTLDQLPLAVGIKCTVAGSFCAVTDVMSGWLIDISGSYSTPFLVLGIVEMVGGMCGILVFYLYMKSKRNQTEAKNKSDVSLEILS